jgi:hypothetical protein
MARQEAMEAYLEKKEPTKVEMVNVVAHHGAPNEEAEVGAVGHWRTDMGTGK